MTFCCGLTLLKTIKTTVVIMLSLCRYNALPLMWPRKSFMRMASSAGNVVVSFKDVSYEYKHEHPILNEATFTIRTGNKVTIMGQNGSGKSTIIKLINGSLQPDSGSINTQRNAVIATAMQVMPREYRDLTVLDFFKKQLHGVDSGIESRIANVLKTVQLVAANTRQIKSFSGGQQARLLLASALALEPDVLLMDEPTNNLDIAGIEFLTEYIQTTDQTCVVISHDEHFLNSFSDSVLYLDVYSKKVEQYDGDYDSVKADIAARIQRENAANTRLQKEAQAKKDQAGVFANKGGGMRKVAQKMREEAEKKQALVVEVRKEDKALKAFCFPFSQGGLGGHLLVTLNNILKPGGELTTVPLRSGTIQVSRGEHLRIRGPNGVGKTTLLEAIANDRIDGVTINPSVKIGYYRQDFDNLNYDWTVLECLQKAAVGGRGGQSELEIRQIAAAFFLVGDKISQQICTLSEGQKGLVSLACLVLQKPSLLIMDEPTNHINFRHLPALAKALSEFEGGLILVSHDEDFVSKVRIDKTLDLAYELGINRKKK